jgi:hypothetical protein
MKNPACKKNIKKYKPTLCTFYIDQEDYNSQVIKEKFNGSVFNNEGGVKSGRVKIRSKKFACKVHEQLKGDPLQPIQFP